MDSSAPCVLIVNTSHTYGSRPGLPALDQTDLQIPEGQFAALIGQSGCGKSTMLRILAGLLKPTTGHAQVCGLTPHEAAAARRTAWMAQKPALLPWLSVSENLQLALRLTPAGRRSALTEHQALAALELDIYASLYPHELSGGMQQRLALARLLLTESELWLMDEPFSALDELTREQVTNAFIDLWQTRKPAVLWVTHHIAEAVQLADRVLVMSPRPGRIVLDRLVDRGSGTEAAHSRQETVNLIRDTLQAARVNHAH